MQLVTADDGTLYTKTVGGSTLTSRTVPAGVTGRSNKPSFAKYRRTTVISGRYDRGVTYRDDLDSFHVTGIAAPATGPVITGGGSGLISGVLTAYFTFVHMNAGNVILESAPSPASESITVTNVSQINWSSILGTAPSPDDDRVTHVRLYRQLGSTSARLVTTLAIGTTTYTDTTTSLATGAQMRTTGGVPPYVAYNCTYKKRVYYAGDPDFPNRIWYSDQEDPENVDVLSFFSTTSGEAVTGLGTIGDVLVVFTSNTTDIIQEHSTNDFSLKSESASIGCISHWSIVNIHNRLWFASQGGIFVYDGNFKYVIQHLRSYWKTEYATFRANYEACFAADDRPEYCYILSVPKSDHTWRWVLYYLPFEPAVGGGETQPWTFFDRRARIDKSLALLSYGGQRLRLYVGSDDGYMRQEDVDTDPDDDDDSYLKALTIQTKHLLFDDPGGDLEEGKQMTRLWTYMESENNAWTVKAYGGDESAPDQVSHNWKEDVAASLKTVGATTWVAQTVHTHGPDQLTGRGFTFKYTANSPDRMKWRGLGGYWTLGPASRGKAN